MAKRPCARSGCPNVVDRGYCDSCRPRSPAAVKERLRGSSWSRGYDAAWIRFREWFIRRHPLCVDCLAKDFIKATEEVHHVLKVAEHLELRLVENNCMALCHDCHSSRTAKGE